MANFEQAVERTLQWEGGYSVDPHDPGGETLFGVARKRHPEWSGWQRVDELKKHFSADPHALAGVLSADGGLRENAKSFYEDNFWNYDDINTQAIANKVFDMGVNMGPHVAVGLLQDAVNVDVDGKFGPHTLEATNNANSAVLWDKLVNNALAYYKHLITEKPDLQRYWHDWSRRAQA